MRKLVVMLATVLALGHAMAPPAAAEDLSISLCKDYSVGGNSNKREAIYEVTIAGSTYYLEYEYIDTDKNGKLSLGDKVLSITRVDGCQR